MLHRVDFPKSFSARIGQVWTPSGILKNQMIQVKQGSLFEIRPWREEDASKRVEDWFQQALLPLGVDPQVHLRVPGQAEKETALTGLKAALAGGVGAVLTMPNTVPPIDSAEIFKRAELELHEASKELGVEVLISGAISKGQKGEVSADLERLVKAGARAFTDDGFGVEKDELMETVFKISEKTEIPVLQHAEFKGHGGVLAPGSVQSSLEVNAYPPEAEWRMVERDLKILKNFPKAHYHVLHVSSPKSVELVARAKKEGLHATCEVSPHHLLFSTEDIDPKNTAFKMNPPLRSPEDREKLQTYLAEGKIDFVATDHAPHEPTAKGSAFESSAFGTVGLESELRTLLKLWAEQKLSAKRLVEVFSKKPAEFLGIENRYGDHHLGKAFQGVLVDLEDRSLFRSADLESLSKNSCFIGVELRGKIEKIFTKAGCFSREPIEAVEMD
jgi:dihydroorotase